LQDVLQDRREVYRLLQENGIAVPMHIVVNRDGLAAGQDPQGFVEEVGGCIVWRLSANNTVLLHLATVVGM
jgi:hypothetical protein